MDGLNCLRRLALLAGLLGLAACGGGGSSPAPGITIGTPTAQPSYATTSTDVRLGGLVPGDNLIIATADADGTGARTATASITVSRPLQPAALVINAADRASATTCWTDTASYGSQFGTGRATTNSALTQLPGPPASFTWAYDGVEAIVVSGCASCSFQRISRIAGSVGEGGFYGQVQTVGGAVETAAHYFQLTTGSL